MKKNFFLLILLNSLAFTACKSQYISSSDSFTQQIDVDFKKIFETALKLSGNRVPNKIAEHPDTEGSIVYSAKFPTKKRASFDILELTVLKSKCSEETASKDLKPVNRCMGPSGASYELFFCAGMQSLKLADFSRPSMSGNPNGIGLVNLAQFIQAETIKARHSDVH